MDLFSFLRGSPAKQVARLRKKVKQPFGDPAPRINACRRLLEMGTVEALQALLDRFTISAEPSRQDEDEKQEVFSWFVECGEKAVEPIARFLKRERHVYWPVRILRQILPQDRFASTLEEVLRHLWESPPAVGEPKAQILRALEDIDREGLRETVGLFLDDEDDDVRLAAADYFFARPEEVGQEPVLRCYLDSEDTPRIRSHILERFAQKGWSVRGFRPRVEESLPEGYVLTRDGTLKVVGRNL